MKGISKFFVFSALLFACQVSEKNPEMQVRIIRIYAEEYDKTEITIRSEDGFILRKKVFGKDEEKSVDIPYPFDGRLKIEIREVSENGDVLAEGETPLFSPEEGKTVRILVIPVMRTSEFNLYFGEWASAVELGTNLYMFTENGDIMRLDYLTWGTKKIGSFSPRRFFSLTVMNGKIIIAGGETKDGRKLKLVEFLDTESGKVGYMGELGEPRSEHTTLKWGEERLVFIGGDEGGTCEIVKMEESGIKTEKIIECMGEQVRGFSSVMVDASENFARIFISSGVAGEGNFSTNKMLFISISPGGEINHFTERIDGLLRANQRVVKIGKNLFVFGGDDGKSDRGECEILRFKTNSLYVSGKMLRPRRNFSVIPFRDKFIILGGETFDGKPVEEIEVMEGGCVFRQAYPSIRFVPRLGNCALSLFSRYGFVMCEGNPVEIFPLSEYVF